MRAQHQTWTFYHNIKQMNLFVSLRSESTNVATISNCCIDNKKHFDWGRWPFWHCWIWWWYCRASIWWYAPFLLEAIHRRVNRQISKDPGVQLCADSYSRWNHHGTQVSHSRLSGLSKPTVGTSYGSNDGRWCFVCPENDYRQALQQSPGIHRLWNGVVVLEVERAI